MKNLSIRNILKALTVAVCLVMLVLTINFYNSISLEELQTQDVVGTVSCFSGLMFSLSMLLLVFHKPRNGYQWLFWAGLGLHVVGLVMGFLIFDSEETLPSWNLLVTLFIFSLGISLLFLNGLGTFTPKKGLVMEITTFIVVVSSLLGCGIFILRPQAMYWWYIMSGMALLTLAFSGLNIVVSSRGSMEDQSTRP